MKVENQLLSEELENQIKKMRALKADYKQAKLLDPRSENDSIIDDEDSDSLISDIQDFHNGIKA
jgi:hypothetical protein